MIAFVPKVLPGYRFGSIPENEYHKSTINSVPGTRPATQGDNRAIAPEIFKACLFIRYNKIQSFCPPHQKYQLVAVLTRNNLIDLKQWFPNLFKPLPK